MHIVADARDWVVAVVSVGLGITILTATLQSSEFLHQMPTVQKLTTRCGPSGARIVLLGVSALLIFIGGALVAGWGRPQPPASPILTRDHARKTL